MAKSLAISSTTPKYEDRVLKFAQEFKLNFITWPIEIPHSYDYVLLFTEDFLGLQNLHEKKFAPFYIDFLSGKMRYRTRQAGLKKELLARAMGVSPHHQPTIIDATAGLGRDSFILATLGFQVTMIERSSVLYLLLNDALARAELEPSLQPIRQRLDLIYADATAWLSANQADIVYLDPMFPDRKKSASVKKEMVILQDLLGKDDDSSLLFTKALACARRRVVVKRPRLAAYLTDREPSFSLSGQSSRFDIYQVESWKP